MKRSINGFTVDWAGELLILVERQDTPKHGYQFEASADRKQIKGLHSILPADIPKGDPEEDAQHYIREAGKAAEEFLRGENPPNEDKSK